MKNTREHILKVALSLFLRDSYKGVTMQQIVKATGLSKGAFYHYFDSKESLFESILKNYFEKMMVIDYESCSNESLYQFYNDIRDQVSKKTSIVGEMDTNMLIDMNYIFLMMEGARQFPAFCQKLIEHQVEELREWNKIVHIAREKGEIRSSMTDDQIAKLFISITDGIGLKIIISKGTIDQMFREVMSIWDGIYNQLKV